MSLIAYVEPLGFAILNMLVDELVELASFFDHVGELEVFGRATCRDVGCFATHVLAVDCAIHKLVKFRTSVAAVDVDGLPVAFPQGVENLIDQGSEVLFHFEVRTVPQPLLDGGFAFQHFADGEVLHGSIMVNG